MNCLVQLRDTLKKNYDKTEDILKLSGPGEGGDGQEHYGEGGLYIPPDTRQDQNREGDKTISGWRHERGVLDTFDGRTLNALEGGTLTTGIGRPTLDDSAFIQWRK